MPFVSSTLTSIVAWSRTTCKTCFTSSTRRSSTTLPVGTDGAERCRHWCLEIWSQNFVQFTFVYRLGREEYKFSLDAVCPNTLALSPHLTRAQRLKAVRSDSAHCRLQMSYRASLSSTHAIVRILDKLK